MTLLFWYFVHRLIVERGNDVSEASSVSIYKQRST